MSDILRSEAIEVAIPKSEQPFVVSERIVANTLDKSRVKIAGISTTFLTFFSQKIEQPKPEIVLQTHRLLRDSTDADIIDAIGGNVLAEVFMSSFYFLLDRQKLGTSGCLLRRDSEPNLFYIQDFEGVLRTVSASWDTPGWYIDACEIDKPSMWMRNLRVFSRRPAFKYTIPREALEDSTEKPAPFPAPVAPIQS